MIVEVRYEYLIIEVDCYVGIRVFLSLLNVVCNFIELLFGLIGIWMIKRIKFIIFKDIFGIVKLLRYYFIN